MAARAFGGLKLSCHRSCSVVELVTVPVPAHRSCIMMALTAGSISAVLRVGGITGGSTLHVLDGFVSVRSSCDPRPSSVLRARLPCVAPALKRSVAT